MEQGAAYAWNCGSNGVLVLSANLIEVQQFHFLAFSLMEGLSNGMNPLG
jgi:hypothetical protein